MKNVIDFVGIVLKQPAQKTEELSKYNSTPYTLFSRLLLQLASSTLQQLHFLKTVLVMLQGGVNRTEFLLPLEPTGDRGRASAGLPDRSGNAQRCARRAGGDPNQAGF